MNVDFYTCVKISLNLFLLHNQCLRISWCWGPFIHSTICLSFKSMWMLYLHFIDHSYKIRCCWNNLNLIKVSQFTKTNENIFWFVVKNWNKMRSLFISVIERLVKAKTAQNACSRRPKKRIQWEKFRERLHFFVIGFISQTSSIFCFGQKSPSFLMGWKCIVISFAKKSQTYS